MCAFDGQAKTFIESSYLIGKAEGFIHIKSSTYLYSRAVAKSKNLAGGWGVYTIKGLLMEQGLFIFQLRMGAALPPVSNGKE